MTALFWLYSFLSGLVTVYALCYLSPKCQRVFKFLATGFIINVVTFILIVFGLRHRENTSNSVRKAHSFIVRARKIFLGLDFEVRGTRILSGRSRDAFIIVCNHQSALDVLFMGEIWNHLDRIRVAVKSEFRYFWPYGIAMSVNEAVFVDRSSSGKGRNSINEAARDIQKTVSSMFVFPEGTRNFREDMTMLPFKKGAFHVAFDAQLPILPIVLSHYHFLDGGKFESGNVIMQILDPISVRGLNKEEHLDRIVEETRTKMQLCHRSISVGKESIKDK